MLKQPKKVKSHNAAFFICGTMLQILDQTKILTTIWILVLCTPVCTPKSKNIKCHHNKSMKPTSAGLLLSSRIQIIVSKKIPENTRKFKTEKPRNTPVNLLFLSFHSKLHVINQKPPEDNRKQKYVHQYVHQIAFLTKLIENYGLGVHTFYRSPLWH
jgi:hypothetical protein